MRKVINGRLYDTDTAKMVGDYEAHCGDFSWIHEALFRKKTGEFFVFGEGGPASAYSVATGQNSWSGGEKIVPLSRQRAQSWVEEHLSADEYEGLFGEIAEDDSRRTKTYSLAVSAAEKIARVASERGISQSALIEQLVDAL